MILPNPTTIKLAIGIACALALAVLVHDRNRWKAAAGMRAQQVVTEKAAHLGTVANYRAAAARARDSDARNAARVRLEQAQINERTADDFESRISAARARAQQLRGQAASTPTDPGAGQAAPVPGLPAAARDAAQAAGEDGFPASEHSPQAEVAPLGADDALIATEQAIQLDALIKWVRAQAGVEPNASPQRKLGPQAE